MKTGLLRKKGYSIPVHGKFIVSILNKGSSFGLSGKLFFFFFTS